MNLPKSLTGYTDEVIRLQFDKEIMNEQKILHVVQLELVTLYTLYIQNIINHETDIVELSNCRSEFNSLLAKFHHWHRQRSSAKWA